MNTFHIEWKFLLTPSINIVEIFVRGTIVYLFLFLLLRTLRREAGSLGISDVLLVVLIADASQNAMAFEHKSITDGLILVSTIAFWNYFLDWLGYKFPPMRRLLTPRPVLLVKDGQIQKRNLKHEMITEEDLIRQLREQGVERVEEVKKSYMEAEGHISVIKNNLKNHTSTRKSSQQESNKNKGLPITKLPLNYLSILL